MSSSREQRSNRTLWGLSAGLMLAVLTGGALFHGFGFDLMSHPEVGIPCIVHALTGVECPGCGMTRALVLVSQLEWGAAFRMNALVYLLLGLAALNLAHGVLRGSHAGRIGAEFTERLAAPALGLTLLHWIYRLAT